jgi:hypothetical protein
MPFDMRSLEAERSDPKPNVVVTNRAAVLVSRQNSCPEHGVASPVRMLKDIIVEPDGCQDVFMDGAWEITFEEFIGDRP